MMYDDLVNMLRLTVECDKKIFPQPSSNDALFTAAADAIDELQGKTKVLEKVADHWCNKVPKWIPVMDRLPDVWKHVITFDEDDGVRVNWRCGDNVSWSMGYHVTHWMPLPEPPEEDIPMEYFESGGK